MKRRTPLRSRAGLSRRVSKGRAGRRTGPTRAVRAVVLERDGGCVLCGTTADLQVHHRLPRRMGGRRTAVANAIPNLISLCAEDHAWAESSRVEALEMGLLLREGDDPAGVPVAHRRYGAVYLTADGGVVSPPEWGL